MHGNQCKGEFKMSGKTKEVVYNNFKLKVKNFPIEICSECGEYTTNLTDGVKVDLYARDIAKQGKHSREIEIDFSIIAQQFDGKDIVDEVMSRKSL